MRIRQILGIFALNRASSQRVIGLAYPIVLASLAETMLSVVDTILLGRTGAAPLAASGVAGVLFLAILFPLSGTSIGVQTLVARRFGEGDRQACGKVAGNGLLLALTLGIILVTTTPWLVRILAPILSNDPEVISLGADYLTYRLLGSAFFLVNWTLLGFFAGIGQTRYQMVGSILITAANILLDLLLIFGYAGFPKLGIRGAAIASAIATGLGTAYYVGIALLPRIRKTYAVIRSTFSVPVWIGMITRLALPVVLQRLFMYGSWFAFFGVVARIGTIELAASNVVRSVYNLPVMLAIGLGTASATLVGQNLGAGDPLRAERLAWEASKLAAYAMGLIGMLFIVGPHWFLGLYISDAAVISAGRLPLILLGFVQILAGIALVLSQSLQGAGSTRFVMITEFIVCSFLYLPIVYLLGLHTRLGLLGAWLGEYVYWTSLATVMVWRFRTGKWKSIVV